MMMMLAGTFTVHFSATSECRPLTRPTSMHFTDDVQHCPLHYLHRHRTVQTNRKVKSKRKEEKDRQIDRDRNWSQFINEREKERESVEQRRSNETNQYRTEIGAKEKKCVVCVFVKMVR